MLKKFTQDLVYCAYCPKLCRFACPVTNAERRETVTPTVKLNLLDLVRKGAVDLDEDIAEIMYRCAGCLTCRAYCKHRIDVPSVIEHARELAVNRGAEPEQLARHIETFSESRNPYGPALPKKLEGLDPALAKHIGAKSDTLYFIGCATLFHYPGIATAIGRMLEAAGMDFAVHADAETLCCGTPALFSGAADDMRQNAKRLAEVFKNYKTVITGCPSCLASFKIKYPQHGIEMKTRFLHSTEFAASLLREGKLKPAGQYGERIMYHDPCHLAKYFGIYEEPREILRALFPAENLIEFSWNRDKNYCCGGGGLLPVTAPRTAKAITNKRLEQFVERKPDMLVTACPTCQRTFHRAAPDMKAADVISLLAEKL